jgi:hypothetical protein
VKGVLGTLAKLEIPGFDEGFDQLSYVRISSDGEFEMKEWRSEV